MVKRLTAILLLCLLLPVLASASGAVIDEENLFTSTQIARMEEIIARIRDGWQIDGAVLTPRLSSMTDRALQDYTDRYFEDNGYGLGEDRAGFLFMIDMGNRYMHISTAGVMIDYLDDDRIEELLDTAYDGASDGNYGAGTVAMLEQIVGYLQDGIKEGHFRFDAETGQRLTGLYNKLTQGEAVFAVIVGIVAAALVFVTVSSSYSLKGGTYHYDLAQNAKMKLRVDEERFLRQTQSRTRLPSGGGGGGGGGHSGGSSVHVSSGGMSHGGGGRHF